MLRPLFHTVGCLMNERVDFFGRAFIIRSLIGVEEGSPAESIVAEYQDG